MSHARPDGRMIVWLVILSLCSAAPAFTCSIVRSPDALEMLLSADAIVRARPVESVGPEPEKGDLRWHDDGRFAFRLRFEVLEVLHGGEIPDNIELEGKFSPRDDFNDHGPPYHFVRPGGRHGNCWAYEYKAGAEYLLFLKRVDEGFTIGWYALGPVNEQVSGADDAWIAWTRTTLQTHANHLDSQVPFPWAPYEFLLGTWRGDVGREDSRRPSIRSYSLGPGARHLLERLTSERRSELDEPTGPDEQLGIWSYDRGIHAVVYRELGAYGRPTDFVCRLGPSDVVECTEDRPESHWARRRFTLRPNPDGGWTEVVETIVREEGIKTVYETDWSPSAQGWAEGIWKVCYEADLEDVYEIDDGYLLLLPDGRYIEYSMGCCYEDGTAPMLSEGRYWASEETVTLKPRSFDQHRASARVLFRRSGKGVFFDDLERPHAVIALSSGDDLNYAWCKTYPTDHVD